MDNRINCTSSKECVNKLIQVINDDLAFVVDTLDKHNQYKDFSQSAIKKLCEENGQDYDDESRFAYESTCQVYTSVNNNINNIWFLCHILNEVFGYTYIQLYSDIDQDSLDRALKWLDVVSVSTKRETQALADAVDRIDIRL